MGRGKPDEDRVGGSAKFKAPSTSCGSPGSNSVTTSRGDEFEPWGGMIKGITVSTSSLRLSVMVTGTESTAAVMTSDAAAAPSVLPSVTKRCSPASVSSSSLVVTSVGDSVVGPGVMDGRVVGRVVGSGGVVGSGEVVGILVVATVMGAAAVVVLSMVVVLGVVTMVVVARAAVVVVAVVITFLGLAVGGAEVGSLNWGR